MANLLSEFPPVSTETWEGAIHEDLKGADRSKLIWRSPEGIDVKPYYRAEDIAGLKFLDAAPGDYPYVRGTCASGGWRIREQIDAVDAEEANSAARCAIAAGAEEIAFTHVAIGNASDLGIILANLGEIPLHFEHSSNTTIGLLLSRLSRRASPAPISAELDWSVDLDYSAQVVTNAPECFRPVTIPAHEYGEQGATAVEEVGLALAAGVDFMAAMQERGVAVDRIARSVAFSFAMGPEFFMQIAKLRAFRMVWAQAVESFGGNREGAGARIFALTSRWNQTIYDPYVNVLRATTEAMAAVLGGAESICVAPYDRCFRKADEASRRLARNTQIILKQEALLARVADAGGGSYYLESVTDALAQKAWKQFQNVEAAGGFRKASAMISHTLEQRRTEREKGVSSGRFALTGTNRFADAKERALDRIDEALANQPVRAALPLEKMRLHTERHADETGKTARVLLAEIGDPKMRTARSTFAADFLACAGLATHIERFESSQQIAAADADLIVLCSSDPEYLSIATELLLILKARGAGTPVLVAGNPETADQLRAAGIRDFVHLRSNPLEFLTRLQEVLGMSPS